MQWCGLWAMPGVQKAIGDDFGVVAWPAFSSSVGKPSTFAGGWGAMVSAKARDVEAAQAFVKWLWIDNAAAQADLTGRPSVILCDTKVGRGVPLLEDREKAHFMRIEEHEWQTCREQLTAGYEEEASR